MPRKRPCPAPGTRKYGKKTRYTADTLEKALNDIKTCKMSQRVASETYNIPRSTLKYKLKNKHNRPVGKPPVLSAEEEDCICSHIVALADHGIPVSMQDVRVIVKKYLDDQNRSIKTFKNNLPGWEWGKLFLERHSDIKQKFAHCISRKRAQVTQDIIQQYFENLRTELEGVPPSHIFNFDETGFHDNPKKERLLFKRECRNPEIIRNSTKSCFTVMFCANAAGEFVPLYVIYKAKQKWSDWIKGAPPGTRMAVTPSGWIDASTFDDWFETQLLPILKNKEGKKVIIGDNLSSHITTKCLRLCAENNIKFICLVPNSTHLLQPLDVSYFSALKTNWRQILRDWRNTKRGKIINALPKGVFAALLSKTIEAGKQTAAQNVIAGFKACGLYPFDSEVVLKKLKDYTKPMEEVRDSIGETFKNYLTELRDNDLQIKQNRKFQIPVVAGKSVSVEEVEKYYQEREAKEKGQKKGQNKLNSSNTQVPTKKKGRPIGSKNKPKSNAAVSSITNVGDTSLDADNTSIRSQTPVPGPSNIKLTSVGDSSVNQPSLLIDGTSHDVEAVCRTPSPHTYLSITDHDISFQDQPNFQIPSPTQEIEIVTSPKDITGEYEVHQGTLEKVDNGNRNKKTKEQSGRRYCVVKHEECLFPGRITRAEGPTCTISVMQKTFEGWKWPAKPDLLVCNQTSIVSYIDDKNIIKRGDSYMIEDHFLYMEWGD